MIIGAYFTDGTCLVAPPAQAAQLMGISEGILKSAMDGRCKLRNVVITKLPNDTPHRIPAKVPKAK